MQMKACNGYKHGFVREKKEYLPQGVKKSVAVMDINRRRMQSLVKSMILKLSTI